MLHYLHTDIAYHNFRITMYSIIFYDIQILVMLSRIWKEALEKSGNYRSDYTYSLKRLLKFYFQENQKEEHFIKLLVSNSDNSKFVMEKVDQWLSENSIPSSMDVFR